MCWAVVRQRDKIPAAVCRLLHACGHLCREHRKVTEVHSAHPARSSAHQGAQRRAVGILHKRLTGPANLEQARRQPASSMCWWAGRDVRICRPATAFRAKIVESKSRRHAVLEPAPVSAPWGHIASFEAPTASLLRSHTHTQGVQFHTAAAILAFVVVFLRAVVACNHICNIHQSERAVIMDLAVCLKACRPAPERHPSTHNSRRTKPLARHRA